jgi:hypothetical protein
MNSLEKCDDSKGWLENIPYIWWEELGKETCVRKYLFYIKSKSEKNKSDILAKTETGEIVLTEALELSKTNPDISPYSYLVYSKKDIATSDDLDFSNPLNKNAENRGELRMNGEKLKVPEDISNSKTISVKDLYFYLSLSQINITKISSLFKASYEKSLTKSEFPQDYSESSYVLKRDPGIMKFCFLFWYIENISKYSGVCMPVDNIVKKPGVSGYSMDVTVNDIKFDNMEFPENIEEFKKMIGFCMSNDNVNRIVFSVGINYKFTKSYKGHANVIIIDKKELTNGKLNVYIFDPWGKNIAHDKNKIVLYRLFDKLGIKKDNTKYKFIQKECSQTDISSNNNKIREHAKKLSTRLTGSDKNFCQVWALWMVDLFLKKSLIKYEEIMKYYQEDFDKDGNEFIEFIDKYTNFLTTTCNNNLTEVDSKNDTNTGEIISLDYIKLNNKIVEAKRNRSSVRTPNIRRLQSNTMKLDYNSIDG